MDSASDGQALEFLVDLISYASVVSAAIFGMLGLFTEYKKDGRITLWGRLAAGGIGLSAVFAMTSAVLQRQISSREQAAGQQAAARQREEQQERFNRQLGQLLNLNRRMNDVNRANRTLLASMEDSLRTQDVLLTNARRSMLLTAGLGVQERESTARVLRTMWSDANRINPSSLVVTVGYECFSVVNTGAFPRFLAENATMLVNVAPLPLGQEMDPSLRRFTSVTHLVDVLRPDVVTLRSSAQQVTVTRTRGLVTDIVKQVSRFTSFDAVDMRAFSNPDHWRGAMVEVFVYGFEPDLVVSAVRSMPHAPTDREEALARLFNVADRDPEIIADVLPCVVDMSVVVNGRLVASSQGVLAQMYEGPADTRGRVIVRFPIVRADPAAFPSFGSLSPR